MNEQTVEDLHMEMVLDDPLYQRGFQAGASSRDAEVAELLKAIADHVTVRGELGRKSEYWRDKARESIAENDQLRAQINALLEAIAVVETDSDKVLDFDDCIAMCVPIDAYHGLVDASEAARTSTPERSLVTMRNAVREDCAVIAETLGGTSWPGTIAEAIRASKEKP